MACEHIVFLSVPGLRPRDIDIRNTPTLFSWANRGALAELTPTFPCVTSCVQATMWTGSAPGEHGVIANGFYHRNRNEVEFWVGRNGVIQGKQIWDELARAYPGFRSAAWHGQNIKDAAADFIVTPEPIHEPDGTTKLWCYSKPPGLYQDLINALGHFPLMNFWGPMSNIQSTRWILQAAARLHEREAPNFHWIYVPHLDYAAQKFGPDSTQAVGALNELDQELGLFAQRVCTGRRGESTVFVAAGEYALTDVTGVIYPNRALRQAGLLLVQQLDGCEHLDIAGSQAFAMVDHQFVHVFVNGREPRERAEAIARAAAAVRELPGVATVLEARNLDQLGLEHERCGDVVAVSRDTHWFAYYWWLDDAVAPPFARTVDIHRKPGFDPVELFFDPVSKGIPLDASFVRGSHGVPAVSPQHRTALVCSKPSRAVRSDRQHRDSDINGLVLKLFAEG